QALEDGGDRSGDRAPEGAVEDEHGERLQAVERGPLARLGGHEVAPLLTSQATDDDAANAHGAGPGEGLGVDPRADHQDRPGQPDVERSRAQPAVPLIAPLAAKGKSPTRRIAERLHAEQAAALGADADGDAGPDVADDPG